jgi:PAS domain-containing protein
MKPINQDSTQLRVQAETRLERKVPSFVKPNPGENLLHELMHELRVTRIEMEMQNETLRQSEIELESSRDRYVNFYDFALVGYLTISRDALIEDINLPGAELLGVEREKLIRLRFSSFVIPADRDRWYQLFTSSFKSDDKRHCPFTLQKGDGTLANVMLICQRLQKSDEEMILRIVLSENSENPLLETAKTCETGCIR